MQDWPTIPAWARRRACRPGRWPRRWRGRTGRAGWNRCSSGLRLSGGGPAEVVAKTGTLYFVSSLAGYLNDGTGRARAFAIFTADADRRAGYDPSSGRRPAGARGWNGRAKRLQRRLLERWGRVHGG